MNRSYTTTALFPQESDETTMEIHLFRNEQGDILEEGEVQGAGGLGFGARGRWKPASAREGVAWKDASSSPSPCVLVGDEVDLLLGLLGDRPHRPPRPASCCCPPPPPLVLRHSR
ncbi:hypothetical protein EJB05_16583 [Eragrostis curvula]|uniref:Uncharacterized protein n=1 Tax=Eragrostis curvula TaxID=38414 RepID=A0A5J9VH65_9POAL|nr:hypothetical protein EJB05_16583 [Eragrostis curvula]